MLATSSPNYKSRYLILAIIIILIVITTIFYFVILKSEKSSSSLTSHTIKEKPVDDTTIEKNKYKEGLNSKNSTNIDSRKASALTTHTTKEKSANNTTIKKGNEKVGETPKNNTNIDSGKKTFDVQTKASEEGSNSYEYSYLPALFEKAIRYYDEVRNINILIEKKFSFELENFGITNIARIMKLLKENSQILTPDCPGILNISDLIYYFDEIQKMIREKYQSWKDVLERPMDLELLNLEYINKLFENGEIKKSIDIKQLQEAKKSLFENIPISILIDWEIDLLEIKDKCFRYCVKFMERNFESNICLLSEIKNLGGTEKFKEMKEKLTEETKKVLKQSHMDILEKLDLKTQLGYKDYIWNRQKVVLKQNMEILIRLNAFNVYIMGKRKITKN